MQKLSTKRIFLIGVFVSILGIGITTYNVWANPFFQGLFSYTGTSTAAATSTYALVSMSAGNSTTTLVFDSNSVAGSNVTTGGTTIVPDKLTLLIQLTASSTETRLDTYIEQSRDGIDWYAYSRPVQELATSTTLSNFSLSRFSFASTTIDYSQRGRNINRFFLPIDIHMRFVRAIIVMPIGSYNGMIHAELVPIKQTPE